MLAVDAEWEDIGNLPSAEENGSRLPRPLHYASGKCKIRAGFEYQGERKWIEQEIKSAVYFDNKYWRIGLVVVEASSACLTWGFLNCLVQTKVIRSIRERFDGDEDLEVYAIVTRGEELQFFKLNSDGEFSSSPTLFLTGRGPMGILGIWSYLRDIIHAIQARAPLAPPGEECINASHPLVPPVSDVEGAAEADEDDNRPSGCSGLEHGLNHSHPVNTDADVESDSESFVFV